MTDPHDREPIDDATIAAWRLNYGLDKRTPAQASKWWADKMHGLAPAGCVAALGVALDDLEALRKEAARYRWLKSRSGLTLRSEKQPNQWKRIDGTTFSATHSLAEGGTQHAPAESLDALIDAALAAR